MKLFWPEILLKYPGTPRPYNQECLISSETQRIVAQEMARLAPQMAAAAAAAAAALPPSALKHPLPKICLGTPIYLS